MRTTALIAVLLFALVCGKPTQPSEDNACDNALYLDPPYNDLSITADTRDGYPQTTYTYGNPYYAKNALMYRITAKKGAILTVDTCQGKYPQTAYVEVISTVYPCDHLITLPGYAGNCDTHNGGNLVQFTAPETIDYWILIDVGFNGAGPFELTIDEFVPGCSDAKTVEGPYDPPVTLIATTSKPFFTDTEFPCGFDSICSTAWFEIHPQYGALVSVTTCGNYSHTVDTALAVLEGDNCVVAECLDTSDDDCDIHKGLSTIEFAASADTYFIFVTVLGRECDGEVELTISETNEFSSSKTPQPSVTPTISTSRTRTSSRSFSKSRTPSKSHTRTRTRSRTPHRSPSVTPAISTTPSPSPSNAPIDYTCLTAEKISSSKDIQGSTANNPQYASSCGGALNVSPAFWLELDVPTGTAVTLSTCSDKTEFDTQVGVLDSCSNSTCVAFNDDSVNCPVASASYLAMTTRVSPSYVFVTGYGDTAGEFELSVKLNMTTSGNA